NDQLSLRKTISANYGEHAWQTVADQLAWKSSDDTVASINDRRGNLYEDIENFDQASYGPKNEFVLSGLKTGETTITATHARTGMATSVDLTVKTLKDELFLFQAYPRLETTLTYLDGKGTAHQATSDPNGRIAIYSEDGLSGDVNLQSMDGDQEYRATVSTDQLTSGETDSTQLLTYPVNSIQLQEVANATLHFQTPDGKPYTGQVNLNGGVYMGDQYITASQLVPQGQDNLLTPDKFGAIKLTWDITRWGNKVPDASNFTYRFEARFPGGQYLPMIVETSTTAKADWRVAAADHVTTMISAEGVTPNTPFLQDTVASRLADGSDALPAKSGGLGPTLDNPTLYVDTNILWPGTPLDAAKGLSAQMVDTKDGTVPGGQSYKDITYPFSSMPVTHHEIKLDESTLWMGVWEKRPVEYDFTNNGTVVKTEQPPFTIINGLGEPVDQEAAANNVGDGTGANNPAGQAPGNLSGGIGNSFLASALRLLSSVKVSTPMFKMYIAPTDDPAVFQYVVQANVGGIPGNGSSNPKGEVSIAGPVQSTPTSEGYSIEPYGADPVEWYNLSHQDYVQNQKDAFNSARAQGKTSSTAKGPMVQIGGYLQGKIFYNHNTGKWDSRIMAGYETIGGGFEYSKSFNMMAGPVPVTFSIGFGASLQEDVTWQTIEKPVDQSTTSFSTSWNDPTAAYVRDDLIHLGIAAYVDLFGGIGIDYSIVAFKIGLFGTIQVNLDQYFLHRGYTKDTLETGGSVKLTGTFGARVEVKILFASFKVVLFQVGVSSPTWGWGQWRNIAAYWKSVSGKELEDNGTPVLRSVRAAKALAKVSAKDLTAEQTQAANAYAAAYGAVPGQEEVTLQSQGLESRDYLKGAKRAWTSGARTVKDTTPGLNQIETNAYPNAGPQLLSDGSGFLYLDDQSSPNLADTRVAYSASTGQAWTQGTVISDEGQGDSQLSAAGDATLAAAAWTRQSVDPTQDATSSSTGSVANMMASAEVEAAVKTSDGQWVTTQLSQNSVGDISPAVSVGGGKVLVAWRQVATSAQGTTLDFDSLDRIVYRVYDVTTGVWGPTLTAYNGTNGSVQGLTSAILPDGKTGSVVYTVQTGTDADTQATSIASVIDLSKAFTDDDAANGATGVTSNVQVTAGNVADANPQVTVVTEGGQALFLAGWHTSTETTDEDGASQVASDIRLYAYGADGQPVALPDSLAQAGLADSVIPNADFKFAHQSGSDSLDQTVIVWADSGDTAGADAQTTSTAATSTGSLKAVRLTRDNQGKLAIASPITLATMPKGAVPDSFDARTDGTNTQAVVLATRDWKASDGGTGTPETVISADGDSVELPARVSSLYDATGQFGDGFDVTSAAPDFTYLHKGAAMPVSFTITNTGVSTLDSVSIDFQDSTAPNFSEHGATRADLDLAPGQSTVLSATYNIPTTGVEDPQYRITAQIGAGDNARTVQRSDTMPLQMPEVGVVQVDALKTDAGERDVRVTLNNNTDVALAGTGRKVVLTFADASGQATDPTTGEVQAPIAPVTISDDADLEKIDEGVYTLTEPFDLATYVKDKLGATEVPDNGIDLTVTAQVQDADGNKLGEVNPENDYGTVTFPSLIAQNDGATHTVETQLDNSAGNGSTVKLDVDNLSLQPSQNGNVMVTLLDADGNPIATRPAIANNADLLSLPGEGTDHLTVHFAQTGARAVATYYEGVIASGAELATLTLTGVAGVTLAAGQTAYQGTTTNLTSTLVTAGAADPAATVRIAVGDTVYSTGEGAAATTVPLTLDPANGATKVTTITVTVTAASGEVAIYQVDVSDTTKATFGGLALKAGEPSSGGVPVTLADPAGASDMWDGATTQVTIDQNQPTTIQGFTGAAVVVATLTEPGTHTVSAQITTKDGTVHPVAAITVQVADTTSGGGTGGGTGGGGTPTDQPTTPGGSGGNGTGQTGNSNGNGTGLTYIGGTQDLPETLSAPRTRPVVVKTSSNYIKLHQPRGASQVQYRIRVKGTQAWSKWQFSPTFRHLKPGKKYEIQLRHVLAGIAASVPSGTTTAKTRVTVKFKSAQAGVKAKGLPKAKAVKVGAKLHKPKAPHAKGYSFKGWYTNKARTHKYNFHKKIKKTITLYAGWKQ
ncbi:MAG: InlB B-repeat-containing protein, partial [Bifidobacteriaceae bacterium]|nr:InlB B-repeat-containing protein [Bifidobacteriaceae bacterium]